LPELSVHFLEKSYDDTETDTGAGVGENEPPNSSDLMKEDKQNLKAENVGDEEQKRVSEASTTLRRNTLFQSTKSRPTGTQEGVVEESNSTTVYLLNKIVQSIEEQKTEMKKRFESIDKKIHGLENHFHSFENRLQRVEENVPAQMRRLQDGLNSLLSDSDFVYGVED